MKTNFRYQLESSPKRKGRCPNCKRSGKYRYYYDTISGERLDEIYGRCDRENNCGYHKKPDFKNSKNYNVMRIEKVEEPPIKYIPNDIVINSMKENYSENNFHKFIIKMFGVKSYKRAVLDYFFTSLKDGSTAFWHLDFNKKIRGCKSIMYDEDGHRNKSILIKRLYRSSEGYRLCLFGEHLLNESRKPVAIVESEKTAIISSIVYPKYTWLASGSSNGLTSEKIKVLTNRKVILIPDLDEAGRKAFQSKYTLMTDLGYDVKYIDLDPETDDGTDLADIILKDRSTLL